MQKEIPHYGDILRKVERAVSSCTTIQQLNSARRLANLFSEHCMRIGVKQESVWVLDASITNKIEDKWTDLYENMHSTTTE